MNAGGNVLGGSKAGSGPNGFITSDGWSIAVNGGYEMPLGDLRDIYKAAPTFGFTLSKKINHNIFSAAVDYRSYMPKQSDFTDESAGFPIIFSYSNFTGINIYLGAAHEWLITNSASFYLGVNGGYMTNKFDFIVETPIDIRFFSQTSGTPFLGPKLGLNFAINNKLSLGAETRYNFTIAKGSIEDAESSGITKSIKSVAGNLFLTYSF